MPEPHDLLGRTGWRGDDKDCFPYVWQISASLSYWRAVHVFNVTASLPWQSQTTKRVSHTFIDSSDLLHMTITSVYLCCLSGFSSELRSLGNIWQSNRCTRGVLLPVSPLCTHFVNRRNSFMGSFSAFTPSSLTASVGLETNETMLGRRHQLVSTLLTF